jgi:hypothetical protein
MIVVRGLKNKLRLYRRFETDIWGDYFSDWRNTQIGRYLLMKFKERKKKKKTLMKKIYFSYWYSRST